MIAAVCGGSASMQRCSFCTAERAVVMVKDRREEQQLSGVSDPLRR